MSDDIKRDLLILQEILNQRKPYLKAYRNIEVETILKTSKLVIKDDKIVEEQTDPTYYVKITYCHPKIEGFEKNGFESIEFPVNDLPSRIAHYKDKLDYEIKKYGEKKEVINQ